MIDRYLLARYEDGGRDWPLLDCWGLLRLARHELFGLPLLNSLGDVRRYSARNNQRFYRDQIAHLVPCEPEPGAIAAAFRGELCVHVGLVVRREGRLQVLEINPVSHARTTRLGEFSGNYTKVIFYRDRILREQARP